MKLKRVAIFTIRIYKKFISPGLPSLCRFSPTCSDYSMQAIDKYGLTKGTLLSLKRLIRCHPFHPGGIDPVP